MYSMKGVSPGDIQKLIDWALQEDLDSQGDVTSEAIFSAEECETHLVSKDTGILAGSEVFSMVFERTDPETKVLFHFKDGDSLRPENTVATLRGKSRSLLSAERVALNFLCYLSGIATTTRAYVKAAGEHGRAQILDTRKTLPGFRSLSKYAVRMGGGHNHRMGLYDMVLIKDNHIDMAGSVAAAVGRVRKKWGGRYRVEVECRDLEEVRHALDAGVEIVMLDNMSNSEIEEAVRLISGRCKIEVSGNVDLERVRELSSLGVDYISIGRLTHSTRSFDFSLKTVRV
jgi:nicotinate-nucleotide pyrophosphorylase (carboxylating)